RQFILDNNIFVPVYRLAFVNAQGLRMANPREEIIGSVPLYVYVGPYEDVKKRARRVRRTLFFCQAG
ncbi:MAG TPA: hypothetical protein VHL09_02560, partial [Dehalococcoidia bacterium]|nr:hypothetical protein [Dehalococcoidia bacterium]